MLIIRWFFPFLLGKTRYFPTLIRGEGGYVIQLKCPNYFWPGLWKWFDIFNQMACFTGYIHLCRRLVVVCFRHLANFNQWDFWNVMKKILFMTKFPAVNLYSRTLLTRVGLLQFPLDLTKTFQSWLEESPLIINYCLQGERLFCYVQASFVIQYYYEIRCEFDRLAYVIN